MNYPTLVSKLVGLYATRVPAFTWGGPGVGKSAAHLDVARVLAKKLGLKGVLEYGDLAPEGDSAKDYFGYIDMRLLTTDPAEIGGFPDHDKTLDVMRRVPADWFPSRGRTDLPDYGIIMFDEWNAAGPMTQAASYQIAHERRISDKVLKEGWWVCGAGNRVTDGGAAQRMQTPLANRLAHLELETDPEMYANWGIHSGNLTPSIVTYLRNNPDNVNQFDKHIKNGSNCGIRAAFATERSWHNLAKWEQANDCIASATDATALVGEGMAVSYATYAACFHEMPDINTILTSPHDARVVTRPDVLFAVTTTLAAKTTPENMENVVDYLVRLDNPSFATRYIQDTMGRVKDIHKTRGYMKWVENFGAFI